MIGTDVRTSSRTSYCLYDVRRRRVRDSDVLVDVQRLVRRFPSNAGAMGVFMSTRRANNLLPHRKFQSLPGLVARRRRKRRQGDEPSLTGGGLCERKRRGLESGRIGSRGNPLHNCR
ncbi:hypothetical protein NDU88_002506 [Pleurodeles waltl]|uniref:Uncharacterized protein n=1 Tax=Pleurodeles waltl TaxID=8319 RepID=A0AAV7LCN9_PLEWA|nr:hypothetical protein NDU88_002506 [Pleurodeles waltl]